MVNLSTNYLGFQLKNPLVVSASPLSAYVDNIQRMENAGAAAVILPSLFEEQIEKQTWDTDRHPQLLEILPEELKHIPSMRDYNQGVHGYLSHIYQAKRAVNIPIIASLNGYYGGGWVQYARLIESAGADALELNIYYLAAKPQIKGAEIERMYIDLVKDIKAEINIPVAVKLSPYFSALTNMAIQLDKAGADALVLFNRFYQPDFDLETQTVTASLDLSHSAELRLRLRWVAILYSYLQSDLAITGGVHHATDVLKSMAAGAKVVTIASVLLIHGIEHISQLLSELQEWMEAHNYDSIQALQGQMSQQAVADPAAFERANYMNVLKSMENG